MQDINSEFFSWNCEFMSHSLDFSSQNFFKKVYISQFCVYILQFFLQVWI